MEEVSVTVGQRLRALRESVHFSQSKIAKMVETTQATINRYEMDQTSPPVKTFLWYADYFDVSMDYIFGRTDKPQGQLYNYRPKAIMEKAKYNEDLREFIEMCFDPASPVNEGLKEALIKILEEAKA